MQASRHPTPEGLGRLVHEARNDILRYDRSAGEMLLGKRRRNVQRLQFVAPASFILLDTITYVHGRHLDAKGLLMRILTSLQLLWTHPEVYETDMKQKAARAAVKAMEESDITDDDSAMGRATRHSAHVTKVVSCRRYSQRVWSIETDLLYEFAV